VRASARQPAPDPGRGRALPAGGEKYVVVHHARGEDLIEESLKSLEEEFGDRFVRIHRNCLVARHEIVELKRAPDGHVQAGAAPWGPSAGVSRRCVAHLRETVKHLD
jgi:two-component system response regulator AlgR